MKQSEDASDQEWLETLKKLDEEQQEPAVEASTQRQEAAQDDSIVLYRIIQGLDYTPMLGRINNTERLLHSF